MFLLEPNAKYFDIFERTAYNNFIAGFSLEGNSYFYACPLESDGKYLFNLGWFPEKGFDHLPYKEKAATRKEWFPCACRPPNLARYIPQIHGFIYARRKDTLDDKNILVSNVDLAPATLALARIKIPDYMQGVNFLDPDVPEREYVFSKRDRRDEI